MSLPRIPPAFCVGQKNLAAVGADHISAFDNAPVGKNEIAFQDQPGFGSMLQQGRLYVRFVIDHSLIPQREKSQAFLKTIVG